MSVHRDLKVILLLALLLLLPGAVCAGEVRIVVNTGDATLSVLNGDKVIHVFPDIAVGRYGTTRSKRRGDNMTPLGRFRIGWIGRKTRYHRFIGLNYPNLEIASEAFANGLINKDQWLAVRYAEKHGEVPPQDTPLGGMIGIHGIGEGDLEMHHSFNWTNGCVALSNQEIDQLLGWVGIGTVVEIR